MRKRVILAALGLPLAAAIAGGVANLALGAWTACAEDEPHVLSAFAGVYLLVATGFIWAAWAVVATASVRLGWPAVVATTALGVLLVSYLCLMGAVPLSDPAYYSTPWVVPAHLRGRLSLGDRPAGRAMGDRARVSFRYAL